jgi:hypothetical protein
LDWGFFIGFSRRETRDGLFWGSAVYLAQIIAHDKSADEGDLRSTLVEDAWLRYHFVFFARFPPP